MPLRSIIVESLRAEADSKSVALHGELPGGPCVTLGRLAGWIGFSLLAIAILSIGVWCSVAIWHRCAAGEPVRGLSAGAPLVFATVTVACLAKP